VICGVLSHDFFLPFNLHPAAQDALETDLVLFVWRVGLGCQNHCLIFFLALVLVPSSLPLIRFISPVPSHFSPPELWLLRGQGDAWQR
jgi:hypothetical protein